MNKKIKLIMMSIVLGTILNFLWIFTLAYTDYNKSVLVTINKYNEANLEMWILFPLTLFSSIYLFYNEVKELYHEH